MRKGLPRKGDGNENMKVRGVRIHYIYVQNCYKSKFNKTFHFILFLISTSEINHLGDLVGKFFASVGL